MSSQQKIVSRRLKPHRVLSANEQQVGGGHYKSTTGTCPACGSPIQHWDLCGQMPGLVYNATKYIIRHREKGGRVDLEKAIHVLHKIIEQEYPSEESFINSVEYKAAMKQYKKRT